MLKRVFINPDDLWARVEKTTDCPEGELLYSPISVISDDTHTHVYLAGQTARLPINGEVASDDMRDQIRQTCENIGIGLNHVGDIEVQIDHVLDNLTRQIEENGSDWEHCHQVRVWLVEPHRDYRGFMRVWRRCFPDLSKAPTLAYVPSTGTMYPGPLIEIDPTCVIK